MGGGRVAEDEGENEGRRRREGGAWWKMRMTMREGVGGKREKEEGSIGKGKKGGQKRNLGGQGRKRSRGRGGKKN